MMAQMAKRSGARVVGVDRIEKRQAVAVALGAVDVPLDARAGRIAEQIKTLTEDRGADVCVEASSAYAALWRCNAECLPRKRCPQWRRNRTVTAVASTSPACWSSPPTTCRRRWP